MTEPYRTVTVEPENPSNPSFGPEPLAFENSVVPRSSNTRITDPRSLPYWLRETASVHEVIIQVIGIIERVAL
jgi:hypothetical protein